MAHVPVSIAAWAPVHGELLPSHEVARTNAAGRFAFTAPNGKYLLTIGNDVAYTPPPGYHTPDPLTSVGDDPGLPGVKWQATVHDTIVLAGGKQHIEASTLPRQIIAGRFGGPYQYASVPTIERGKKYRISKLSGIEAECLAAEQIRRLKVRRSVLVPDEWLMENTRAMHRAQVIDNAVWDGFAWRAIGAPTKTPQSSTGGGSTCAAIVLDQSIKPQELAAKIKWYGGAAGLSKRDPKTGGRDVLQIEEWFNDPRLSPQIWPSPVTGPPN